MNESLHSVQSHTVTRVESREMLGFSHLFGPLSFNNLPVVLYLDRKNTHLVWGLRDDPGNGTGFRKVRDGWHLLW